ncbi:13184_t:CDS:2 [Acaulospora morrowiae]|uniref:13184_t:CDS:1 n=1 Tax=Acaulospora morrowiae TaxID=94023 RepID=A0A9N9ABH0_9GLOM|nr:13184_t:CDS:2 [Acaulospora morrowiae]
MSIEPTFQGYIETTQDTLLIFEACRRAMLTRICRRLQEKERKIVTSGSVFVFDERESGIKRWTDGLVWSPSRILGNFLIYRELDKRAPAGKKDSSSPVERQRSGSADIESQAEKNKERALVGSLTNSYRFKKGGLIKKTMSIMVNGVSQHMISYYTKEDVIACKLKTPSSIPSLAILEIAPEFLLKQNFRIPPVIESTYEQELDGMSYGKSPSTVSSASPHAILPKPGGGTVSPSRLANMEFAPSRVKMEMENSSTVEIYRPTSSFYSGSNSSSNYHPAMHSQYASSYATPSHHHAATSNGVDGTHTLPMPQMRPYISRPTPYHDFPPPRLLTQPSQSNQPLIPSIGSHQNDYNGYYHSSSPQSYPSSPQNYSAYSSHSSTHTNNPTTVTAASAHGNNPTFNTLSQVPLYTTGNPYNDLSQNMPDLYNTLNSPSPTSASQSHQHHEHLVTSPSPTLPAISSPTSTSSINNNNSSSNAPVTPPLSSPSVNPGSGGNSNIFGPYYTSLIKNESYHSSVSSMLDPYFRNDSWEMRN